MSELETPTPQPSKARLLAGRALTGLVVLFLIVDGAMKVVTAGPSVEAMARLGYSDGATVGIGALLLACTAVYLIPRTAALGSILLTGYLGGAVASHVRAGDGWFPVVFCAAIGALVWLGLYLRDSRLRVLAPWQ